jgi:molybdopterin-biosynthesis enzyme MoeA-like protein
MTALRASTAAAIVIGNELLSGKIEEKNLLELSRMLRELGIRFVRAVVIADEVAVIRSEVEELSRTVDVVFTSPDVVEVIARDVREFSQSYGYVITSGGVGPTHDDVTIEAVAQAFGVDCVVDPVLERLLKQAYGENLTEAHLRMALVPRGAELVSKTDAHWPATLVRNVFVLPGVPEIFRMKLESVRAHLSGSLPFISQAAFLNLEEVDLKERLDGVVARHPDVEVGSYPRWRDPAYRTKVTFDARDRAAVESALQDFLAQLEPGAVVRVE